VFLHLYRHYKERLFYFKRKLEVDFYVPDEKLLVQVSFSVTDIETKKRETKALENAMRELKIKQATIITYDEEETIDTDDYSIQVIPVWQWLL
jgi:predicted AAA+ superfamily ATPase